MGKAVKVGLGNTSVYSATDNTSTPCRKVIHRPHSPIPCHFQGSFKLAIVPVRLIALRLFGQVEPQHVLHGYQPFKRT